MKGLKMLLTVCAASLLVMFGMDTRSFAAEAPDDVNSDVVAVEVQEVSSEQVSDPKFEEIKRLMNLPGLTKMTAEEAGESAMDPLDLVTRAGNETWTGSGFGGAFTFKDNNLTPIKVMGKTGTLYINGYFYGDDGYADSSPIKLTFQIRSTSGNILVSRVFYDTRNGAVPFSISCNVTQGQQIQLFMDASSISNPPGPTRVAYIAYDYDLY